MTLLGRRSTLGISIAVLLLAIASASVAEAEPEPDPKIFDDLLLLPEFELDTDPDDNLARRGALRTLNESYSLINETVSDAWNISISPLDWRAREWLVFLGVAGATTGLIYLADEDVREAALDNGRFQRFGDEIQAFGRGPALLAVTGGFLLSGMIFRDKEIETAKMLIEASAIGQGYSTVLKRAIGRKRRAGKPQASCAVPSGESPGSETHPIQVASRVSPQGPDVPAFPPRRPLGTHLGIPEAVRGRPGAEPSSHRSLHR